MNYYKLALIHVCQLMAIHSVKEYEIYLNTLDEYPKGVSDGLQKARGMIEAELKLLQRLHRADTREKRPQRANSKGKQETTNGTRTG